MTLGRRVAVALVVVALIGVPIVAGVVRIETPLLAVGQEPSTPVVFEVAAVKPNKSGQRPTQIEEPPGGRYIATNAWLRILILQAYGIQENQLVGAPDWTRTERFDINAKLERGAAGRSTWAAWCATIGLAIAPRGALQARGSPGDPASSDVCPRDGEGRSKTRTEVDALVKRLLT